MVAQVENVYVEALSLGEPKAQVEKVYLEVLIPTSITDIASMAPQGWWRADTITGKSDGDPVTSWADQSGNGYDGTAASGAVYKVAVTPSGGPALRFSGASTSESYTTAASVSEARQTIAAVVQHSGSGNRTITGDVSGDGGLQFRVEGGSNVLKFVKEQQADIGAGTTAVPTGQFSVVIGTWNQDTDAYTFRINGAGAGSGTSGQNLTTGRLLRLGAGRDAGERFVGDIAEVVTWARVLSGTEITLAEAELTSRWLSVSNNGPVAITGSAGTVASAGTATTPGAAAVTGTAGSVSSAGTVAGITTGAVAITGSAGAVVAAGDVPAPITGTVAIAGAAGTVSASDATVTFDYFSVTFESGADLTLAEPLDYEAFALSFESGAALDVLMRRQHTIDPVTGLPQYRLRVVTPDGTGLAELPQADIGDLVEELNDAGDLSFTLPKYDAATSLVTPRLGEPVPEVQVWRGPNLEGWLKVDGKRDGDGTRTFDCSGLIGYLDARVVGQVPKRNLLLNGDFTDGLQHWDRSYLPGSIPAAPPVARVVDVDFYGQKRKAVEITGQDEVVTAVKAVETAAVFVPNEATFLSGGAAIITAAAEEIPDGIAAILIEGHTAFNYLDGDYGDGLALSLARANAAKPLVQAVHPSATITTVGKGRFEPVASNDTYAGQAKNRRVELHYSGTITAEGHRQYLGQTGTITNNTGRPIELTFDGYFRLTDFIEKSLDGYGVWIQLEKVSAPDVIVEEANSTIDENTPQDSWQFAEASITVPANGIAYRWRVRYFPPDGTVQWTGGGLFPDDALFFPDGTDQALIVKGLVEHGQDPAFDKLGGSPILLGTRTPLSGVTRSRTYLYHERRYVGTCVDEFAGLFNGMDISVEANETERWVATHYPRKGQTVPVVLALGSNVVDYDAPTSVLESATRAIVQGLDQSGANRREGIATDTTGLGGTLLEKVVYAKPDTPVTELEEAAFSEIARHAKPVTDLVVTVGLVAGTLADRVALTSDLLDRVKVGDTVDVEIIDGDVSITGPHRVVRRILTPNTDTLRYALTPEV